MTEDEIEQALEEAKRQLQKVEEELSAESVPYQFVWTAIAMVDGAQKYREAVRRAN